MAASGIMMLTHSTNVLQHLTMTMMENGGSAPQRLLEWTPLPQSEIHNSIGFSRKSVKTEGGIMLEYVQTMVYRVKLAQVHGCQKSQKAWRPQGYQAIKISNARNSE